MSQVRECSYCGTEFTAARPKSLRMYCKRSCRQREYERRNNISMGELKRKPDRPRFSREGGK